MVVGAPGSNVSGHTNLGIAYLFHGSASGISSTPAWTSGVNSAFTGDYGYWVAGAGDVNGDGFDDVLVADSGHTDASGMRGRVYGYYGSASGLSTAPDWIADEPVDWFGRFPTTAGDVNADGFDDVIMSTIGQGFSGHGSCENEKVYVYHGSSTELATSPSWTRDDPDPISGGPFPNGGTCFGQSVAAAGDVDGDGYDDVIVGAPWARNWGHGRAYLFRGSATGLESAVAWQATSHPSTLVAAHFGWEVSGIGDINADGYEDVIIYAQQGGDPEEETFPMVYVYLGTSSGLEASPAWSIRSGSVSNHRRVLSYVGDVDADGFDDLLIGGDGFDPPPSQVRMFHGSLGGPIDPAAWMEFRPNNDYFGDTMAGAGDVNGDGYADIVVGEETGTTGQSGYVYIFHGGPNPPPTAQPLAIETLEDTAVDITLEASDLHGDLLVFSVASPPASGGPVETPTIASAILARQAAAPKPGKVAGVRAQRDRRRVQPCCSFCWGRSACGCVANDTL